MAPSSGPERVIKKPALEIDPVQREVANGTPMKQGNVDLLQPPAAPKTTKKASGQDIQSQYSGTPGAEDEAEVYTETRMLQAPDGRPSMGSTAHAYALILPSRADADRYYYSLSRRLCSPLGIAVVSGNSGECIRAM